VQNTFVRDSVSVCALTTRLETEEKQKECGDGGMVI
jgi:hypothetical protein